MPQTNNIKSNKSLFKSQSKFKPTLDVIDKEQRPDFANKTFIKIGT